MSEASEESGLSGQWSSQNTRLMSEQVSDVQEASPRKDRRRDARKRNSQMKDLKMSNLLSPDDERVKPMSKRMRHRKRTDSSNEVKLNNPYMASGSSQGGSSAGSELSSDNDDSRDGTLARGGRASSRSDRQHRQGAREFVKHERSDPRKQKRNVSPHRSIEARAMAPRERANFFQKLKDEATQKMKTRLLMSRIIISTSFVWTGWHLWKAVEASNDERLRVVAKTYNALGIAAVVYVILTPSDLYNRVFTTDERTYREEKQDGALVGFLLPPLASSARLIISYRDDYYQSRYANAAEPGRTQASSENGSRILLSFNLIVSFILLGNALLSRIIPADKINRKNRIRIWVYSLGSWCLAFVLAGVRYLIPGDNYDLGPLDILYAVLAYQLLLYWTGRLMRKSFTFGELGIAASGGAFTLYEAATVSFVRLNRAGVVLFEGLAKHPMIRISSPLVVLNLALILGPFVVGTLLWPILTYNRNLAQRPMHKVRQPAKIGHERQILALVSYSLAACIVYGLVGKWCQWILALNLSKSDRWGANPWAWATKFVLYDGGWTRRLLLIHWLVVVWVGIAAIQHHSGKDQDRSPQQSDPSPSEEEDVASSDMSHSNLGLKKKLRTMSVGGGRIAINGGIRKPPVQRSIAGAGVGVSLNLRRKFFHALALIMFVPGVVFDTPFLHLALSLAFAIFSFVEIIRYFALYPFGAAIHVFLTKFLDNRDSGPVILSHFYLLTGCALPIWFGGPSKLANLSGIIILGIGDSAASVIGKRYGKHSWPDSHKTVEGTLALIASVVGFAVFLEKIGWIGPFNLINYMIVVTIAGVTEAVSNQNDNLIIPILMWSLLSSTIT